MSLHGGDIWSLQASHGLAPEQVLDFSSSLNPLGVPDSVRRLLAGQAHLAMAYPDAAYAELRQGLAAWVGALPDQIAVGNGASELIREILLVLKPRRILVPQPGFAEYARAAGLLGIEVLGHPLAAADHFRLDPEALIGQIHQERPDLVFVCNPNNPTSRQLEPGEMARIAQACAAAGVWLVVDETFIELSRRGGAASLAPLLDACPKLVVLRALTKVFALAGLRLGYLVCASGLATRLRGNQVPWSVNGFAARLGGIFTQESAYLQATVRWMANEPDRLYEHLRGLRRAGQAALASVIQPDSNFILCRLPHGRTAALLRLSLLDRGILIRDCGNFAGLGPEWFRVAVREAADNQRLLAALAETVAL